MEKDLKKVHPSKKNQIGAPWKKNPLRLGLGTEVHLWSQFHILLNWKIFNFVGH